MYIFMCEMYNKYLNIASTSFIDERVGSSYTATFIAALVCRGELFSSCELIQWVRVFPFKNEVQSESSVPGRFLFCFEVCLNTVRQPRPSPTHLALKIPLQGNDPCIV